MQRVDLLREIISAIFQWTWVLLAAVLPIALDIDVVRRLRRSRAVDSNASWRQRAAYVGAASNVLVFALPITFLIHNVMVTAPWWDWRPFQDALVAAFALSIALAIVGPKYVRAQLTIGVLLPFFFWLIVSSSSGIL